MKKLLMFVLLASGLAYGQLQDTTHFFDLDTPMAKKLFERKKDTDNPSPVVVVYENVLNPREIHVELCHDWLPAILTKRNAPAGYLRLGRDRRTGLKLYVAAQKIKKACQM